MRRKLATASWLVAVVLALVVSACGGSSSDEHDHERQQAGAANALKKGTTVNFWIMPNGPQPQADMEKTVKPFEDQTGVKVNVEVVGWDVQLDRIRNAAVSGEGPDVTQAGTTQVPFFAALGGFAEPQRPRRRHRRQGRLRAGRLADDPGRRAQDGTFAVPWFTEARAIYYRKDVLEEGGHRPRDGVHRRRTRSSRRCRRSRTRCRRSAASRSRRSARPARRRSTSSTT